MTREELLSRIRIDPSICFGKPCIRGHRIWVSLILDLLASGMKPQEVLDEYPGLVEEDIHACIAYGAEMSREGYSDAEGATGSEHDVEALWADEANRRLKEAEDGVVTLRPAEAVVAEARSRLKR